MRNFRISCISPQSMTVWPSCVSNRSSGFPSEQFAWEKFLLPVFRASYTLSHLSMICWPTAAISLWPFNLSPLLSQRRLCSRDSFSRCLHLALTGWMDAPWGRTICGPSSATSSCEAWRQKAAYMPRTWGSNCTMLPMATDSKAASPDSVTPVLENYRAYFGVWESVCFSLCASEVVIFFFDSTHTCARACACAHARAHTHTHTHSRTHKQPLSELWLTCEYVSLAVDVGRAYGTLPGSLGPGNWILGLQVSKETEVLWWK